MTTTVSSEQASPAMASELENSPPARRRAFPPFPFKWVVWSLGGIAIVGWIGMTLFFIQQFNLQRIRITSLEAAFRSGQIRQLSGTVTELEDRVNALPNQFVSRQDFATDIADVKLSLKNHTTSLDQAHQSLDELNQTLLNKTRSLQQGLDQQALRLDALAEWKTQWDKHAEPQKDTTVLPGKRRAVKKPFRSVRARAVPLTAPFILTGIEHRGGQIYAVVAPRGADSLSQMQLLAPGDFAWGWTLHSTQGNEALFSVNGTQQRLTAQ
jgi:hypothetical protein